MPDQAQRTKSWIELIIEIRASRALSADEKFVLIIMLTHGVLPEKLAQNVHGPGDVQRIFPSVDLVAEEIRKTPRTIQKSLDALRRKKVLVVESGVNAKGRPAGGSGLSTVYRYNRVALLELPPLPPRPKRMKRASPFSAPDDGLLPVASIAETVNFSTTKGEETGTQRVKFSTKKGEAGFTRSVPRSAPRSGSGSVPRLKAGSPTRHTENGLEDATPNYGVIERIAHEVYELLGRDAEPSEIKETVKSLCYDRKIQFFPPADLVGKAIDSAWWQRQHPHGGASCAVSRIVRIVPSPSSKQLPLSFGRSGLLVTRRVQLSLFALQ
jgi:hypothetical protein